MASFSVPCPKCPCPSSSLLGLKSNKVPFQNGLLCLKTSQSFGSLSSESATFGIRCLNRKQFSVGKLQAKLNEADTVENSKSAPVLNGPTVPSSNEEEHNGKLADGTAANESSISAFLTQVADLVKLVDSRDIVELQLKQSGCELVIRKQEALQPPPASTIAPASPPYPYPTYQAPPAPAPPAPAPASPPPSKAVPALPSPGKASTSSHPPLKCPMAGTFYRSPAPSEPPFVKVGDKVQKGQVICIIEAMKLMNEIEADQSGTIAEIIAEDGKPVSVDTPLFVIVP
ncbi:PREDICTED: biotin carboxyl carrier protein of acetyl-CoA carboxylase, chloroplastic-like isoform X1 [Lupinus angustifolius]|uniref:biotin carboxyl carrier protein of acetyl-CoA carboxylase, chloroplastic-like isoform X1 n=1 Tax=Lupinus angustifolius TaxID=3871 RepID=UPI00092EF14A|nr:PREDICTED: biotin carboxyl carrier protein of acetyl-CoA carboxylase, chloroplastic-like isoform X1 [Lupinus angustifolius]